ncbi:MAG: 16S rRNA (guanine(527)-N(7))-methyltransferase RsmG [Microthrixaceae bacterium]
MNESVDPRLLEVLDTSRSFGLLGDGPLEVHIQNARVFAGAIPPSARVLDMGSGGGLPGLVLAVERPDLEVTLLDSQERRCAVLRAALERLELSDSVPVVRARAEDAARDELLRGRFDGVTARSFGPPAVTAECAVGFLTVGGRLWVSEPPGPTDAARWPVDGLVRLGLELGPRHSSAGSTVQELWLVSAPGDDVPRRAGRPTKRPLF